MEDPYGQKHPDETPELIKSKLEELEKEIDKLPKAKKKSWLTAKQKCPDLTDDEKFRLMFLRCEVFNADVSSFDAPQ